MMELAMKLTIWSDCRLEAKIQITAMGLMHSIDRQERCMGHL